ncbi:hypothetical protein [Amycolatopsis sp. 195334CR]|uniref:hypothetical protein n=1 Tax=Amycolatopsis sp. 195334CR TaxID=2814588 RepID=UPI001A8F3417|nr:hypothetical protein [Amycolatopsis sp. 195334CR]MBN6041199.1 hypothetical protein [Amycolatopsis sp. 195334CR]
MSLHHSPVVIARTNAAAEHARLTVELDEDGWSLTPRATGITGALGHLVAEVDHILACGGTG